MQVETLRQKDPCGQMSTFVHIRSKHHESDGHMPRNRASAKKAGTAFETLIATYLATALNDDRVERRARTGGKDRGDIGGIRIHGGQRLVVECKNTKATTLAGWIAEAHIEAGNDDALLGVVIAKRHGITNPAHQWVHMTVSDLVALITGERQPPE